MIGEIIPQILGIEQASFLDKKSRYFWERLGASFLDKKSNVNDCIQFGEFSKKIILGPSGSVLYGQKN